MPVFHLLWFSFAVLPMELVKKPSIYQYRIKWQFLEYRVTIILVGWILNHSCTKYLPNVQVYHMQLGNNATIWILGLWNQASMVYLFLWKFSSTWVCVKVEQVKTSLIWKSLSPQVEFDLGCKQQSLLKTRSLSSAVTFKSSETKGGFGQLYHWNAWFTQDSKSPVLVL